jgi:glycyl-tRNA synthetase beta subunit
MNYLSVVDPKSNVAMPYYVGVAGYPCSKRESMVEATATVVSGRLDDGAFYYDGDLKTPLNEMHERLGHQLFQAGMGTLLDKSERVSRLSKELSKSLPDVNEAFVQAAELAGKYCKADLRSGCVQEFPDEMQGLMGGILVREQKLFAPNTELVAQAIAEHYAPSGATSVLPGSPLGKIVSLADKLDSLVVLVGHGTDVKGNKDPFALRRTALSILRLLGADSTGAAVPLSLADCFKLAMSVAEESGLTLAADTEDKLLHFALARLKALWRTQFDPGAVEAVCARIQTQSVSASLEWVKATSNALIRQGDEAAALALAIVPYKRCKTLTEDILKSGDIPAVETSHFLEDEEKALFEALERAEADGHDLLERKECERYLNLLADLRHPMANFFDGVLVNADDYKIKQNRLALLLRVRRLYDLIADFSLVQVAGHV